MVTYFCIIYNLLGPNPPDLWISVDSPWNEPAQCYCTGLYALRPTEFSINLFHRAIEASINNPNNNQNDQDYLNNIIFNEFTDLERSHIADAPQTLFYSGASVKRKVREITFTSPWVVHANFHTGFDQKKNMFVELGYWFI